MKSLQSGCLYWFCDEARMLGVDHAEERGGGLVRRPVPAELLLPRGRLGAAAARFSLRHPSKENCDPFKCKITCDLTGDWDSLLLLILMITVLSLQTPAPASPVDGWRVFLLLPPGPVWLPLQGIFSLFYYFGSSPTFCVWIQTDVRGNRKV